MLDRKIGKSNLAITPLMLGGNVFDWTADEATTFAVLDAFVGHGGNSIDTADAYSSWVPGHEGGESETVIGKWLKKGGKRNRVLIGTKVGLWGKRPGLKRQNILDACNDSLRRLNTDTIDLYWLHKDDDETPPEEFIGALDELVQAGKVRAIGASNFKVPRMAAALETSAALRKVAFVAQQPEYNLLCRDIEADLVPFCLRENISILPYFGLASGFLTGKYRSSADFAKSPRGAAPRMDKYLQENGLAVLTALDAVAARHEATCAQIALAWIMAKPAMTAPIASATSVAQVNELMGALEIKLTPMDLAQLDQASI
jgi:aryl-alcohol dehydrogenase-like predicted oxidoreductase